MYIRAKVIVKSKKEKIVPLGENSFEIYCKEAAEQNKANYRVREILAKHFNINIKSIKIISGHKRPQKMLEIKNTN